MSKKNYNKNDKKFDETELEEIFNSIFSGNTKISISSKLDYLYNSLQSDIEKEKMLYFLNNRLVFNLDECKKLQEHLPIYYDLKNEKELDKFIWLEVPENIFSNDFIRFIEKLKNSNLPIAGIYMEHQDVDLSTNYTLEEAKKTCIAIDSFWNTIDDEKNIYHIIENVLEKIAENTKYNYQACDIDDILRKQGYLSDKEDANILRRSNSLYGVFVEHKAICSGIAKAVKQILKKYVFDVIILYNEEHCWNQINVNNKEKYNLDLTTAVVSNKKTNMLELLENDTEFYKNEIYSGILEDCKKFKCTTNIEDIDKNLGFSRNT